MDRIICDICATEYPGTAEVCPVCGYPRQGSEKLAASAGETVHAAVKGGRFSNKNVRKRLAGQAKESSDRGLWITIILLLIGIILVSTYIVLRFRGGREALLGGSAATSQPSATGSVAETAVPCSALELNTTAMELEEAGQQVVLVAVKVPADTTDPVMYSSADPAVAQVSQLGVITAVGPGQTTITVTCGGITSECSVSCRFQEEATAPPETTAPPATTAPPETTVPAVLKLDHEDVSLYQLGEQFTIKVLLGDRYISRSNVTWTSSDPDVATVEHGVVTAVGSGTATITAQYQGQKAVCIVRSRIKDTTWRASSTDVTISVGERFRLYVINGSGERPDVTWSVDQEGVVSVDGITVTGLKPGIVTLYTTVDGVQLWCIVRVK